MAHIRQSKPDYDRGFQVKSVNTFEGVPSPLESVSPSEKSRYLRILVYSVIYDSG
jgi:hypothetical protein